MFLHHHQSPSITPHHHYHHHPYALHPLYTFYLPSSYLLDTPAGYPSHAERPLTYLLNLAPFFHHFRVSSGRLPPLVLHSLLFLKIPLLAPVLHPEHTFMRPLRIFSPSRSPTWVALTPT